MPALPLIWLWGVLIHHLQVEWSLNPQYTYGWAVPFLCVFLLWRRGSEIIRAIDGVPSTPSGIFWPGAAGLALVYAPIRLVEQANPDWRLMSWALALAVVTLTLLVIHAAAGSRGLKATAFPVLYFLVAVPWPIPLVEQPLIQGLTRLNTSFCAEWFGWFGLPVIPHGNVIELSNGVVGVDEACSGIRSFQATLMISLFLGEFYRLNWRRRVALVGTGFALSMLFNQLRVSLLVWVAARRGVAAIAAWHDPAGVTILLACFLGLWLCGNWLKRPCAEASESTVSIPNLLAALAPKLDAAWLRRFALGLVFWLITVEISVHGWYAWHAARLPVAPQWTIAWPTNTPAFQTQTIAPASRQILRYDEGSGASWQDAGYDWSAIYLHWQSGRAAVHLAQNHTPDVCLTAAGHTLKSINPQLWLDVNGFHLPFSVSRVTDATQPLYVFYCLWDDRATAQGFDTRSLTHANRLAPVFAGLRNPGQRSLELLVAGPASAETAVSAVQAELKKVVIAASKAAAHTP